MPIKIIKCRKLQQIIFIFAKKKICRILQMHLHMVHFGLEKKRKQKGKINLVFKIKIKIKYN